MLEPMEAGGKDSVKFPPTLGGPAEKRKELYSLPAAMIQKNANRKEQKEEFKRLGACLVRLVYVKQQKQNLERKKIMKGRLR